MKILMTGGSGYVGSHISSYLASLGHQVENISHKEFSSEDFRRLYDFDLDDGGKPDIVIHCAWLKGDLFKTDHLEFAEMTCHFFDECKNAGLRVINIGTSSEYGVKDIPMKEDMICLPINTYGIAHLATTLYAKMLGFNTLRLFAVYGDGGYSFRDNYEKSDKWSDPQFVRDYIKIKDVCYAVERLIYAKHLYGEIINVCNGIQYSDDYIVDYFLPRKENKNKWHKYPQRQYEPSSWVGDNTKLKQLLNLEPDGV